jgi:hypothetical protein
LGEITILSPQEEQLRSLAKKWEHEESNLFTSGPSNDYGYSLDELLESDVFEEDKSVHNGSSIAFLIESGDAKALFLGDAHAPTICTSLRNLGYSEEEPLTVGLCKLSHHGSKANTSMELLSLIKSEVFIVSTNGLRHGLPNKRTIARIKAVSPNSSVLFNYPGLKERMFNTEELNDLGPFVQDIRRHFAVMLEQQKLSTVIVNNGSGVAVPAMTAQYSYVLTARHNLQADPKKRETLLRPEEIRITYRDGRIIKPNESPRII